jgi:hypothetical protein
MSILDELKPYFLNITSSFNHKNYNLFFNYYKDKNNDRQKELDFCLEINCNNKLFKNIYIVTDLIDYKSPFENVKIIYNSERPKFCDFFKLSNTITDPDSINILINTDIVIGNNFDQIHLDENQIICLSRKDRIESGEFIDRVGGGSHDCWIWKGKINENVGNFYLGKYFCDGVLANNFKDIGIDLKNPSKDLLIYHIHFSNIRYWDFSDHIPGHRTGLHPTFLNNPFNKNDIYCDGYND